MLLLLLLSPLPRHTQPLHLHKAVSGTSCWRLRTDGGVVIEKKTYEEEKSVAGLVIATSSDRETLRLARLGRFDGPPIIYHLVHVLLLQSACLSSLASPIHRGAFVLWLPSSSPTHSRQ